jgi:hypothetical protein
MKSYEKHMKTIGNSCETHTTIIRQSYEHHTKIKQKSYENHMKNHMKTTRKKHVKTIWKPYETHMKIIRKSYEHHTKIIQKSCENHMKIIWHSYEITQDGPNCVPNGTRWQSRPQQGRQPGTDTKSTPPLGKCCFCVSVHTARRRPVATFRHLAAPCCHLVATLWSPGCCPVVALLRPRCGLLCQQVGFHSVHDLHPCDFHMISYDSRMIFRRCSYDFRIIFVWVSHEFHMVFICFFVWFSYDLFIWFSHDFRFFSYDVHMILVWFS